MLRRGETYRFLGFLVTAPKGYDVEVGGMVERECAVNDPNPRCGDRVHDHLIVGVDAWIYLYEDGALHRRHPEVSEGATGTSSDSIGAAIDSLVDSVGKPPQREGSSD